MSHSLPRTLMHIGECGNAQADEYGPIRIETDQTPGSCLCRYRIYCGETLVLRFRLELNVRKANLVIVLPKEAIGPGRRGQQPITRVRHALAHSLSGAEAEGYGFNEVITSDDPDLIEPVFIIRLHDRFMLSAHERLYFAQDLMFFLKSIANELDLWPKQA